MLMLGDWIMGVEDWIPDWIGLPVSIVSSPCCLVSLRFGGTWWSSRFWISPVRVVGLAGSNDGVAEVLLEWNFSSSK